MHPSTRYCKKRAIELICRFRLWAPLTVILGLLLVSCFGVAYLADSLFSALVRMSDGDSAVAFLWAYAVTLCFFALLVSPILYGVKVSLLRCLSSGRLDLTPVFSCFIDRHRYFWVLWHTVRHLACFHLCFFLILLLSALSASVGEYLVLAEREASATVVYIVTLLAMLLVCISYLLSRAEAFLWETVSVYGPRRSYREARRLARLRIESGHRAFFSLGVSFVPLWILSVLLLGIPLIWVVPYYTVARACLASHLIKS